MKKRPISFRKNKKIQRKRSWVKKFPCTLATKQQCSLRKLGAWEGAMEKGKELTWVKYFIRCFHINSYLLLAIMRKERVHYLSFTNERSEAIRG